ncbi:beta-1,4-glucuronyltransferase 1-like [Penaeus japonicus]|uniref:beta-1,4-glucuronyltransferase 1-like n=1 Tax=Penaeus japonicus TaxID=27405 RepID=UPI001C70E3FC|nr:beta-1,4-glucuronyltransferase 1-like [Penaeus japonicus]
MDFLHRVFLGLTLVMLLLMAKQMTHDMIYKRRRSSSASSANSTQIVAQAFANVAISGHYFSHSFVWPATRWEEITRSSRVCLVTQGSVDRIFWMARQAENFGGPVSVAIYTPASDYAVATAMVSYMKRCFPAVEEYVSFHVMYPRKYPPKLSGEYDTLPLDCSDPEGVNRRLLVNLRDQNQSVIKHYPQNHMRNLARRACPCENVLTVDIDMVAAPNMNRMLSSFLNTTMQSAPCKKCAYVVPLYEIQDDVQFPSNKTELLDLIRDQKARIFHEKVYSKNQGNGRFHERWEVQPDNETSKEYRVLYDIETYEEQWEPLLVLPFNAPFFDERFVGFGCNRYSQVYELHLRKYKFQVLDTAFLCHRGFQTRANYQSWRPREIQENLQRYRTKQEIHKKLKIKF